MSLISGNWWYCLSEVRMATLVLREVHFFFLDITEQIRALLEFSSSWLYADLSFSYDLRQNWARRMPWTSIKRPLRTLAAFHEFSMDPLLAWGEFQVCVQPDRSQASTWWAWGSSKVLRFFGTWGGFQELGGCGQGPAKHLLGKWHCEGYLEGSSGTAAMRYMPRRSLPLSGHR